MILFCEECGTRHDIEEDNLTGSSYKFACHTCNETLIVSLVAKTKGKNAQAAMQDAPVAGDLEARREPLRILVVDDSRMIRRVLCDIISSDPSKQVVGEAENGKVAIELIRQSKPDVITLDINMPVMDGLTTLKHIMISNPTPTVMISALTQEGATETFESLKYGAIDFLPKPSKVRGGDLKSQQEEILRKIDLVANVQIESIRYLRRPTMDKRQDLMDDLQCRSVLAFGASEGGYGALLNVIPRLTPELPAAYIAVMHQAPQHVDAFSRYLDKCSKIKVERAVAGMQLKGGTCYLAASTERFLVGEDSNKLKLHSDTGSSSNGPGAIDELMTSVATKLKNRSAGVILTGTGEDGLEGLGAIIREGGTAFVQDPGSCLFKETPAAAINLYSVDYMVSDKQMAGAINAYVRSLTH